MLRRRDGTTETGLERILVLLGIPLVDHRVLPVTERRE
jgi:hypothetical protein